MTSHNEIDDHVKQNDGLWTFPEHTPSRFDMKRANAVAIGISLQEMIGTAAAAVFLKTESVDMNVAARVLSHPAKRRKSDRLY